MMMISSIQSVASDKRRPIRILFVSHTAKHGGAEQCLLNLITGLNPDRCTSIVVTPREDGWLRSSLDVLGIPVHERHLVPWVDFHYPGKVSRARVLLDCAKALRERVWSIAGIIEREAIDVVVSNTVTHIEGALAARACKRPHVWQLHESLVGNSDLTLPLMPRGVIERTIFFLSHTVVGVSEALFRQGYPLVLKRGNAEVVYNGVDLLKFSRDASAKKALCLELGLDETTPLVATIGSLRQVKEQSTFIDAVTRVRSNAVYLVVGSGPDKDSLEAMAAMHADSTRIMFLSARNDINKVMAALDVVVISSRSEAFPLTAVEAMATGIPVITTRCGGATESVLDGETGLHVDIGDAVAMANAIDKLLQSPELAKKYGNAGRLRAEALFSNYHYVGSLQRIYESAVFGAQ